MKKILIYIEPHPIRNMMVEFAGVIDHFAPALNVKNRDFFKIYANSPVIEAKKKQNAFPEVIEHIVNPTPEEDAFFASCLEDWDECGMKKWMTLMRESELTDKYVSIIHGIHKRYPFDYIVHWGTNAAVKTAAQQLNVGYIDMELGCSRLPFMNSIVMDPWGVNGASSISHAHISDFNFLDGSESCEDVLKHCQGYSAYESMFKPVRQHELLRLVGQPKIAFIPLQLYDDANLLQYSPYEEVIDVLEDILPKLQDAGYTCIIKEHPASAVRKGSARANEKARSYAESFNSVMWLDAKYRDVSNTFLFDLAELVVTVNSSTGFEALYFDKTVVVLGEAVYKPAGVFPTLKEYLAGEFDYDTYKVHISKIRQFFLQNYLLHSTVNRDSESFIDLIHFVGDMSKESLTAQEIVQRFCRRAL